MKGYEVRRKSMIESICIILGTRPEIIKMSPVVRACERHGAEWFVLQAGQGCSCDVGRVFFEEMELPEAGYDLDVGSNMLAGTEPERIFEGARIMLRGCQKITYQNCGIRPFVAFVIKSGQKQH